MAVNLHLVNGMDPLKQRTVCFCLCLFLIDVHGLFWRGPIYFDHPVLNIFIKPLTYSNTLQQFPRRGLFIFALKDRSKHSSLISVFIFVQYFFKSGRQGLYFTVLWLKSAVHPTVKHLKHTKFVWFLNAYCNKKKKRLEIIVSSRSMQCKTSRENCYVWVVAKNCRNQLLHLSKLVSKIDHPCPIRVMVCYWLLPIVGARAHNLSSLSLVRHKAIRNSLSI